MTRLRSLLLILQPFIFSPIHAGEISTGIDEEAQLPYWQYTDQGMSLRLVQRLPDQTRAFFTARGFVATEADIIANSCVFQTVFKNISNGDQASDLEYDLNNWSVIHDGQRTKMKLREDWAQEWRQKNIPMPAQIAFEWSLYPTRQLYRPGDYNWGMSIFNLQPGTRFDLKIHWKQFRKDQSALFTNIECARDISADPESKVIQ